MIKSLIKFFQENKERYGFKSFPLFVEMVVRLLQNIKKYGSN